MSAATTTTSSATTAVPVTRERGHASFGVATFAVARRTIRKFVRTPQLMIVGTIQGAMFLLIFRYVFGGAINAGAGVPYVDFLVPGFVMTSVLFVGMSTAAGVAEDLETGFVDRLRSLPMPRLSVVAGRVLADTALLAWNLAVTVAIGFAVGFRLHGSLAQGLAAFGLCVLFGFVFTWLFVVLGLLAGSAQAAQGMALLVFPLTFVSSAYVPVHSMPGWMQAFAERQPITPMVDSVRALCLGGRAQEVLGHSAGHYIGGALLWSLVLVAIFTPIATARFSRG
jgi:ABC transporter DrrB family efflux protein